MNLRARRRDAALAERRLLLARQGWDERTRSLRADINRHRERWIVGGGFASGVFVALLPLRSFGRILRVLTSAASFALRSPFGALLMDVGARKNADDGTGGAGH